MRMLSYRNCQSYLCFSFEPLLGGPPILPWLRSGKMGGPAVFANVKKNKGLQFKDRLFSGISIYTAQDSVVQSSSGMVA
jgi:hypothetical protein